MKKENTTVCDKDCFHCPFEDCINDELDAEYYRAAGEIEHYIQPKSKKEEAIAARRRASR